jgi:methylated-DNA-[protein]-cysteine S-methyltransferase
MSLPTALLDSIASAAVREGLADAVYTRLDTPIGRLLIVQGERGVVRVGFPEERVDTLLAQVAARLGPRIVASDRELAETRDVVSAYFDGVDERLDLPVDLSLVRSGFRRAALTALREVGPGHVVTYGALAARVGHPRAARAIGSACATNPVPIIVPCHRVLPGAGGVGSYGGGPDRKRRLLAHEGAAVG